MWRCTECKTDRDYDDIEIEQDRQSAKGICLICYLAAQAVESVGALGLRKMAEAQHTPTVKPYTVTCVSCEGTVQGPHDIALDFGYRRDGTRWDLGFCTVCLTAEQCAWIDQRARRWMEGQG